MDDEQRKYFATLSDQLAGVAQDVRVNTQLTKETARDVRALTGRVDRLEREVFGSDPPPASPGVAVVRQVSEHDSEIATLAGQVIAARAELAEVKAQNEEQLSIMRELVKAFGNPWVKRVAYAIGSIIVGYATAKGFLK